MRRVALLLLAALLAGCADAPSTTHSEDGPPSGFLETTDDESSGSITGVVVNTAFEPIDQAFVSVDGQDRNATTDAEGRFAFEDLDPGTYFLSVSAARHLPAQTSAEVKAGETTKVRVSILHDGLPDPFHQTNHFSGIINFHATVAWAQLEWMLDSEFGLTTPGCECAFEFTSDIKPQGHVYEAVWEENIAHPEGPQEYYWQYSIPEPFYEVYGYATSPSVHTYNEQPWPEETGTYKVLLLGPYSWVAIDQEFEIFLTHFFNSDAPEGWAISNGDS